MATGTEILAAVKKAGAWGTAVACGANDAVMILSEGLRKRQSHELDRSAGQSFFLIADKGNIAVEGDLPAYLRYDGLTTLLAMAMGTAGSPVQQGGTTAYKHVLQLATALDGKFCTLAIDKKVAIHEYPSVKVAGFTIRGEAGRPCEVMLNLMADDLVVPATVNTASTSWTYRDRSNRILFDQAVFRINDQSGAALGSGDKVKPASFELAFRRKLKGEYLAEGTKKIDEPVNDDLPEISLSLRFPNYTSNAWWTALSGDTRKKCDIVFTGNQIQSPYNYALSLILPHLALRETESQVEGPGKLPNPVVFTALEASSAPTGMSYIKPFTAELINKQTTDPLA